ncbi:MAG: type III-B CRISPR-associated protein Cas10/Cmr2 [Campylobacteraceae bacterium]|jgi:CRISPR-associated protein Cmr2|nr:type III-B CRISPR-associated protein Cas10/Cmr2 [Campylobacteraceae bacterium]
MKYLVIFSITPVQAFINRARKLSDFFVGSKILSYLSSVGFDAIEDNDRLYPSAKSDSIPNKFVFTIEAQNPEQVKSKMKEIEQKIQNAWLELANITGVPKDIIDDISDYWNFLWAGVSYDNEQDYQETHSKAQSLLAAIKFKPRKIRKSQTGEKCPLCGENSVWKSDFGADKKEKLCGVCAIKRLLPEVSDHKLYKLLSYSSYHSVTEIAMYKYIEKYQINKYDIEKLQDETKYNELKDKYGALPTNKEKYYALLAMDGDSMGDTVSKKTTSKEHSDLSEKLDDFNRSVEKLACFKDVNKLIYVGGDDVFAVLSLEEAIKIADEIHDLFREKVGETTISAAIVIAHHKEPLREVIRDTHNVLDKIAKDKAGRNALAIRLKKRGGGERDLFFKWDAKNPFNESETLLESLEETKDALSKSELTSSLLYRLEQLRDAVGIKDITREQILKLFEYEVAHSIGKDNVKENAKRLVGLCLAEAFDDKGELKAGAYKDNVLKDEIFNSEAVVIAHFLTPEKSYEKEKDTK